VAVDGAEQPRREPLRRGDLVGLGTKVWAALCCASVFLAGAAAEAIEIIGLQPVAGDTDVLSIETQPFSPSFLGSAGFSSLSGLDVQPETGLLFASSGGADGGRLFTIDPGTGQATLVGDAVGFDRLPGLAFDLDGTLFASAGGDLAGVLITLDPSTAVGTLVGSFAVDGFIVIEGLAVHPVTGELFGAGMVCENADCLGNFTSELFTVDKTTGLVTSLGVLVDAQTGAPLPCCPAGLAFDGEGSLFASTGFGAVDPTSAGRILSVDPDAPSPAYSVVGDTGDRSISDIVVPEPSRFWLGLVALGAVGSRGRLRRAAAPAA
jgi:hypothetical protein